VSLDLSAATEGELAALTLAGRQAAFAEIMRRHRDPIFRLVQAHLGSADDALDVVQESFVAAFVHLRRYDGARPMRAWLSRIAINKARDFRRKAAVRRLLRNGFAEAETQLLSLADDRPSADQEYDGRAQLQRIGAAISNLPHKLKEPLLLRAIEGLSQSETAMTLRISEKAVETRIRRARIKLREALDITEQSGRTVRGKP